MSDQSRNSGVVYKIHSRYSAYRFGNDGSVWSCWERLVGSTQWVIGTRWHQLKTPCNNLGYAFFTLYEKHGMPRKTAYVHHMILEVFVGPRPDGMLACHNDGNPENNQIDNLRWDTPKSNTADRFKHGTHQCGEQNQNAKLKLPDLERIVNMKQSGMSTAAIARKIGVARSTIYGVLAGVSWTGKPRVIQTKKPRTVKVTSEIATAIRAEYAEGKTSAVKLAKKYGISKSMAHLVTSGKYAGPRVAVN